ncbi:ISL3 family transposase [Enterocloster citroniae]|uniref:Transposase n=1 Tax=Enterocloster citroniae TaxID=358743 RepID=A0ABV2G3W0_9FIRM|nr:ISL3 family transposase [Enterocloster citroniae]MCC3398123.1 ISL3 family transposase [Clostridiales bacterium AHG0011]
MNLLYPFIDRYKNSPQNAIKSFSKGLENDMVAVENAVVSDRSNGFVEWNNNRIKAIKRTMYGRCGLKLLATKVMLGYREDG